MTFSSESCIFRILSKNVKIIICIEHYNETCCFVWLHESKKSEWVLRKMFEPNGEDVSGGWKELQNEEFHNVQN